MSALNEYMVNAASETKAAELVVKLIYEGGCNLTQEDKDVVQGMYIRAYELNNITDDRAIEVALEAVDEALDEIENSRISTYQLENARSMLSNLLDK
jgi:hypothetical protein